MRPGSDINFEELFLSLDALLNRTSCADDFFNIERHFPLQCQVRDSAKGSSLSGRDQQ